MALSQHFHEVAIACLPPLLVDELGAKRTIYGDTMLTDLLLQLEQVNRYEALGVDVGVADAIVAVLTLSQPTFGEVGEEFLAQAIEGASRRWLARSLARHLLWEFDAPTVDSVVHGVDAALDHTESTLEEALVLNIVRAYEFAATLDGEDARTHVTVDLLAEALSRSSQEMRLAKVVLPAYDVPRRRPCPFDREQAAALLRLVHTALLDDPAAVPAEFRGHWDGLALEQVAAVYAVMLSEPTMIGLVRRAASSTAPREGL